MLPTRNYSFVPTFTLILCSSFCLSMISMKTYGESTLLSLNDKDSNELATSSINDLLPENILITESLINASMPELKQSELGKVLTRYYNQCLGGADHWETIKSIKISADLDSTTGMYHYESINKKPNFYKIAISLDGVTNIVAFDGNNKWQKQISDEGVFFPEIVPQMDRMVNETELSSYLLFPLLKEKAFQYKGTVRKFNTVCHQISLFAEQDYLIDYFIDVESYFIVSIKITDTLREFSPVLIRYSDYQMVDGLYLAHHIETFIDGKWDSTLKVNSINTNVGALGWMFRLLDKVR